jgi:WD40 repeat protein
MLVGINDMKFKAYKMSARTLAIDPQNQYLFSTSSDRDITAWKLPDATLKMVLREANSKGSVSHFTFRPDGAFVAYSLNQSLSEGRVEVRETHRWTLVKVIECKQVFGLSWSPDGESLAIATNEVLVLSVPDYAVAHRLTDIEGRASDVAFSKSGDMLMALGDYYDPVLAFWDAKTGQFMSKTFGDETEYENYFFDPLRFLHVSEESLWIHDYEVLYRYDLQKKSLEHLGLKGTSRFPPRLAISPNMQYVAYETGDFEDLSLPIRELATGKVIYSIENMIYGSSGLQFLGNDMIMFGNDAGYITIEKFI